MKRIVWVNIFVLLACAVSHAQYKTHMWLTGTYRPKVIDFNTVPPTIQFVDPGNFNTPGYGLGHSMICDASGVLFSCNGSHILSGDGSIMDNGDYILPKKLLQDNSVRFCTQMSLIIPKKENQFYVFSWGISDTLWDSIKNNLTYLRCDILAYSVVDMNENNGKGKVISKMNYLTEHGKMACSQLSAVKHANGRDWWLLMPNLYGHSFNTFLVTPDAIIQQPVQDLGTPFLSNRWGQSNFSLDGSLYVTTSEFNKYHTQVNHFDRCTGKMSAFKTIPWTKELLYDPDGDSLYSDYAVIASACFSPNNRFLYMIHWGMVYQYDLQTDELFKLHLDTLYNGCGNRTCYNAPDGRIYIGNHGGTCTTWSYIERPNEKGLDADYCFQCFQVNIDTVDWTNNNISAPPNIPNYELGALQGSECDTLYPPVQTSEPLIVPSAFSPNDDGLNDSWHILNVAALQYAGYILQSVGVYNRWGNEVFKSNDINFVWNGKSWASDSYYYFIRYRTKEGVSKILKGSINIVR